MGPVAGFKPLDMAALRAQAEKWAADPTDEDDGCPHCDGSGYLISDNTFVGICRCAGQRTWRARWDFYLKSVARVSNEAALDAERIKLEDGCIQYVRGKLRQHFRLFPGSNSVFLYGLTGVGKTLCAHWLARRRMEKEDRAARFLSCAQLSNDVSQMMDDDDAAESVNSAARSANNSATVLVIDDLGHERSPGAIGRIQEWIDLRFTKRAPTVVTSNLSLSELAKRYDAAVLSRATQGGAWMAAVEIPRHFPNLRGRERHFYE